jgi:FdhD protein
VSPEPSGEIEAIRHLRGAAAPRTELRRVVGEAPLTVEVVSAERAESFTIMRTPGEDLDLALGFLFAEGMIAGADDVAAMEEAGRGDLVRVRLGRDRGAAGESGAALRNLVVNSSCGLCGRAGLEELLEALEPVSGGIELPFERLYSLPGELRDAQVLFAATGGSHAAGLFDAEGFRLVGEDLGRHSAFDKVLGRALRERVATHDCGVLLSGRTSLEMVVKAARARIGLIVSVSAPSLAAVDACERLLITLCGFARGDEVTVYTHPDRLRDGAAP